MTVVATPLYGTVTTMTITLVSLASSTSLLFGRASTSVTSSAIGAIDYLVGGTTMTSTTAPTAAKQIEVWSYGSFDGTLYNSSATGSDADLTVTAEAKTQMRLLTIIPTNATASAPYTWGPFSIAQAYGGLPPSKWGIWMGQNTGQNLNLNSSNHSVKYTPVNIASS